MNEFEKKLYLKYRNMENMIQLLCYDASNYYQVILIKTFYTSKCTSFFTFVLFLNVLPDCTRRI